MDSENKCTSLITLKMHSKENISTCVAFYKDEGQWNDVNWMKFQSGQLFHTILYKTGESLKDLNPAKLPFHSSTDAFVYATHLYTNAINSVCYVTTRESLSHKGLQVNISVLLSACSWLKSVWKLPSLTLRWLLNSHSQTGSYSPEHQTGVAWTSACQRGRLRGPWCARSRCVWVWRGEKVSCKRRATPPPPAARSSPAAEEPRLHRQRPILNHSRMRLQGRLSGFGSCGAASHKTEGSWGRFFK